jgi:ligand-binding SRPBCC domain-containing protein
MRPYVLRRQQVIPLNREQVFLFFSRPENLARITPPDMGFAILTPLPIVMKPGALIDYTIRLMGISLRWTTLITTYEPPGCFIDEQIRGPYSFWHHRHYFNETEGGTEIVDEVHYLLPGGLLGPLAHALFVRRQLDRIFDHRAKVITQEMSGNGKKAGQ